MLEIKNTVTEMKNECDVFISRLDTVEEKEISECEDIAIETSKTEKKREEKKTEKKAEKNIQELWDTYKRCKICVI